MKKIYLSGPMKGYENSNFPAFEEITQSLRSRGWEVVSPHEIVKEEDTTYDQYLRLDLIEMLECDAVVTMDGWEPSNGCRIESIVAILVGIPVLPLSQLRESPL